jgi:hypothetical protein
MICKNCNQNFEITDADRQFYHKIEVPEPVFCVNCRRQQLLAFWPFGQFYQRKCDLTGEIIISTFPAKAPFPIYKKINWLSDKWQPPQLALDLEQPFFPQLEKLQKMTPHYHLLDDGTNTNCDYSDDIYNCKSCYLCRAMFYCEDLYFCYRMFYCKDSLDCAYCYNLEKCYSCVRCWHCYNTYYSLECRDCLDSYFLYDCRNCKNCFLSSNLRNVEYYFKNKKYSPEEYEKKVKEYDLGSW